MSRESNLSITFKVSDSETDLVSQLCSVLNRLYSVDEITSDKDGISISVWNSEHYYLAEVMPSITRIVASVLPNKEIAAKGTGIYTVVDDIYEYSAIYDPKTKDIFASRIHYCRGTEAFFDNAYNIFGCRTGLRDDELQEINAFSDKEGYTQMLDRLKTVQRITDIQAEGSGWVDENNRGFMGCEELADENGYVILQGVLYDYIGTEDCVQLVIPDGVTTIGDPYANEFTEWGAFASCACVLKSVTIPSSVTKISERAFEDCPDLSCFSVAEDNNAYYSDGQVLYTKDGKSIVRVIPAWSGKFEIHSGITSLASEAFYQCNDLTSVIIPDSVTSIGNSAFMLCGSLTKVAIPDSVTSIGDKAFEYCNLTVCAPVGSYAEHYAKEKGIPFENSIRNQVAVHGEADPNAQKWAIENGSQCVEVTNGEKQNKSQLVFKGKTFITTGLSEGEEEAVKNFVIERGGVFKPHFVKTIDYLVYNPNYERETSKYKQAVALKNSGRDITIITYEDFQNSVD